MNYIAASEQTGRKNRRILFAIIMIIIVLLFGLFMWATSTPGESYLGGAQAPEDIELENRLETHVRELAVTSRNLQSTSTIKRSLAYIEGELEGYGYAIEKQEVLTPADNLLVRLAAKTDDAPILIVGAHYDTAGASPGADDNASGVAALLELARELKPLDGKAELEVKLVFYANEEPPYFKTNAMGSLVHARSIHNPERVIGMISLETMGYFSTEAGSQHYPFPLSLRYPSTGNFIAFVGDLTSRDFLQTVIGEFRTHATIPSVGGTAPTLMQGIDWSDHWSYSQQGIPAIMVTDTAIFRNPHYHKESDLPDTLDYARLALVVEGLQKTLRSLGAK
ncbi:M28 family peptidase [Qipengyuania gaetbuli]|uniref:M28 family peptidase n=1 Tax=Qipengyuania gaetbuli TaxID=266952 RepID=UPI001CFE534B|nr:M28 family peptidase [Qipengyuania gaetbuli]